MLKLLFAGICFSIILQGDQLVVSTKWISYSDSKLYFEKQTNLTWLMYNRNKLKANYTQLNQGVGEYGDPFVVILGSSKSNMFMLTEGKCFLMKSPLTKYDTIYFEGYWLQEAKETCKDLPRECESVKYHRSNSERVGQYGVICKNRFDEKVFRQLAHVWKGCPTLHFSAIFLYVKPTSNRQRIIDESFNVFNLSKYIPKMRYGLEMLFLDTIGLDVASPILLHKVKSIGLFTSFNLYKRNRMLKDCQDFLDGPADSDSNVFMFKSSRDTDDESPFFLYFIIDFKYRHPVCSLFFRQARIFEMSFYRMINSYVRKNLISFTDPKSSKNTTQIQNDQETMGINSKIEKLHIEASYGVEIDSKLLNGEIFANTKYFNMYCQIKSIDANVFRAFRKQREVNFKASELAKVINRQGIEWIKSINSDIDIGDWKNKLKYFLGSTRLVSIKPSFQRDAGFVLGNRTEYLATDRDFCLYAEFPFHQLVLIRGTSPFHRNITEHSCTELWLYQPVGLYYNLYKNESKACEFERRLQLCNRTRFEKKQSIDSTTNSVVQFSLFDFWIVFDLVVMILTLLFAILGTVTNLLTIFVIYHKDNKEITREKHHVYMSLHCGVNALICLIQIVNLTSECHYAFGLFCSRVRMLKAVQYVKIVLGEYFNNLLRLMSNFTYLGFSLCRMYKVGKGHGKLIVFANDSNIAYNMLVWTGISAGLSVCKALQFDINLGMPMYAAPLTFMQNILRIWVTNRSFVAILVMNSVYDLINYFLLVLVHSVVDLVLMVKLKRTIDEKERKMRELNQQGGVGEKKMLKENRDSKRRVVLMVVFNSLFNLFTKIPSMITSLNDLRLTILMYSAEKAFVWSYFDPINFEFSFSSICFTRKACVSIQSLGNCLFLLSFSSTLHFLKQFDKNFRVAYEQAVKKNSKKKTISLLINQNQNNL